MIGQSQTGNFGELFSSWLKQDPLQESVAAFESFARFVGASMDEGAGDALHVDLASLVRNLGEQVSRGDSPAGGEWYALTLRWLGTGFLGISRAVEFDWVDYAERSAQQFEALPKLGPAREWLERLAALSNASSSYVAALTRIRDAQCRATADALERFADALEDESQPAITSVRELFDLWITCAESTHKELLLNETFGPDVATLVNALTAMRSAQQSLLAELPDPLNDRSLEAVRSLARRHQELREEIAELRSRVVDQPETPAPAPATRAPRPARKAQKKRAAKAAKRPPASARGRAAKRGQKPPRSDGFDIDTLLGEPD